MGLFITTVSRWRFGFALVSVNDVTLAYVGSAENARVENSGVENVAPECRGGNWKTREWNCGTGNRRNVQGATLLITDK